MSAPPHPTELEQLSAEGLLKWGLDEFGNSLAIATAFQAEGMVIVDMAARITPHVRVFTLDTGRLPEETYRMIETVRERYGIAVESVAPDAAEIEAMVALLDSAYELWAVRGIDRSGMTQQRRRGLCRDWTNPAVK